MEFDFGDVLNTPDGVVNADDRIVISRTGSGYILINNGKVAVTGGLPDVRNTAVVVVRAGAGDDEVRVDQTAGPVPRLVVAP